MKWALEENRFSSAKDKKSILLAGAAGLTQMALPFFAGCLLKAGDAIDREGSLEVRRILQSLPAGPAEVNSWLFLWQNAAEHPIETVVMKVAINIGAPILTDVYYKITDHIASSIPNLRPPRSITLAA